LHSPVTEVPKIASRNHTQKLKKKTERKRAGKRREEEEGGGGEIERQEDKQW
jgi:hypothetical protein